MKWPVAIAFVVVAAITPPFFLRAFTPDPAHEDRGRRWDERHRLEPLPATELSGRYERPGPWPAEIVISSDGTYRSKSARPAECFFAYDEERGSWTIRHPDDARGSWGTRASMVQLDPSFGEGGEYFFGLLDGVPALVGNTETWRRAR